MHAERSFRQRRDALMERHADGPVLVRGAAAEGVNPSFFYLTGLAEPRGALLLAAGGARIDTGRGSPGPDYVRGRTVRQVLFLPAANPLAASWGEDSAATLATVDPGEAGVDAVLDADRLDSVLGPILAAAGSLGYVRASVPSLLGEDDLDARFVARIRDRFFGLALTDATPTVHEQRRSKAPEEVRAIERAVDLTRAALDRVMRIAKPGLREHEVEAEITRVYRAAGARHAFDPIVAAGLNAVYPHYHANSARIEAGQLLLVDTGACYGGYRSDVTRTLPVEGRFSPRQREVYDTVLRSQRAAIAMCRPGALLADVHAEAFAVIARAGFGERFIHGTSHHLGIETHDVGDVHRPLTAGSVITVEPGVYLPDEALGVRIEDDVLVTSGEPRILTASIPVEAESLEARMS